MKTKRWSGQSCCLVLAIFLLLLLGASVFAETPSGKAETGRNKSTPRDPVGHSEAELARASADISPGIRGVLSIETKGELIKIEMELKRSTIPNKNLMPLRVSLEPAEISRETYQSLPQQLYVLPNTVAYSVAIEDSLGRLVNEKEIRDTFLLAMGYPKHIKPKLARNLRVSVLFRDKWLPLPSRYDVSRRMVVTESARQSGTYQLLAVADVVSQDIIAYPNPIQFGEFGGVKRTVKFMNVPLGAVIEIYTVTGDEIREIEAEVSPVLWDGEKENGELVTSGLYIYRVQMPDREAFGKIAVLR